MEKWRLIDTSFSNEASLNLAIEEAIFSEKINREISPSTIRFWRNRKAVILGYSQKICSEVNLKICRKKNVQVVRRFTGGGAVYQDFGNLNYSIVIRNDYKKLKGLDVLNSFKLFCAAIKMGAKKLGVDLNYLAPGNLLIGKRKISGNAQSRKKQIIFHHGTFLINSDLGMLEKTLFNLRMPTTNLSEEIDRKVEIDEVIKALIYGFEKSFSMKLKRGVLTPDEQRNAKNLCLQKYSQRSWNFWR